MLHYRGWIAILIFAIGSVLALCIFYHPQHLWISWLVLFIGVLYSAITAFYCFFLQTNIQKMEEKNAIFSQKLKRLQETLLYEINKRKENENRLIKAMKEARSANASKNEFIANISHELRTPLNSMIGFTQCLLMGMDGDVNPLQEKSLKKIEKCSFQLLTLINSLLDLAKIEAKKMELEINSYNIVELIASCVEEMTPISRQKGLEIEFFSEKTFILLEMDPMRIRQVLLNLLSNAIKFTEEGIIKIFIKNHRDFVQIDVSDTGIGLTSEEVINIFSPFAQADSSITRKYGGTGLGLVISQKIVELHGGEIFVNSVKGEGSTFSFTLPKFKNF